MWDDPSAFKPDRFAPGGTEELTWSSRTVEHGKQGGAMLSFGGGHHMCTGRRFGFLQVTLPTPYPTPPNPSPLPPEPPPNAP